MRATRRRTGTRSRRLAALGLCLCLLCACNPSQMDPAPTDVTEGPLGELGAELSHPDRLLLETLIDPDTPLSEETLRRIRELLEGEVDTDTYLAISRLVEGELKTRTLGVSDTSINLAVCIQGVEFMSQEDRYADYLSYEELEALRVTLKYLLALSLETHEGVCAHHLDHYHMGEGLFPMDQVDLERDADIAGYADFLEFLYGSGRSGYADDEAAYSDFLDELRASDGTPPVSYEDENIINYIHFNGFDAWDILDASARSLDTPSLLVSHAEMEELIMSDLLGRSFAPPVYFFYDIEVEVLLALDGGEDDEFELDTLELPRWTAAQVMDYYSARHIPVYIFMQPYNNARFWTRAFGELRVNSYLYSLGIFYGINQIPFSELTALRKEPGPRYAGEHLCAHHLTSYHTFTPELIASVGEDRYQAFLRGWSGSEPPDVVSFVERFRIDRETFEALHAGYAGGYLPYDTDRIYNHRGDEGFRLP